MRYSALILGLVALPAFAGFTAPTPVSPGTPGGPTAVAPACPTFSWGAVPDAAAYEIEVSASAERGSSLRWRVDRAAPVLRNVVAGAATSWTVPIGRCLPEGRAYAWRVREVEPDRGYEGTWSGEATFEVAAPESAAAKSGFWPSDGGKDSQSRNPNDVSHDDLSKRLDDLEAKLDAIAENTAPVRRQGEFCVNVVGVNPLDFEAKYGGVEQKGTMKGTLGLDFYGNGIKIDPDVEVTQALEAKLGVSIASFTWTICWPGAGKPKSGDGAKANPVEDAIVRSVGEMEGGFSDEILDKLVALGIDPEKIVANARTVTDEVAGAQLPDNPFDLVDPNSDLRRRLRNVADALPVPEKFRERVEHVEDRLPSSPDELNMCSPDFAFPVPAGRLGDAKDRMCETADRVADVLGVSRPLSMQEVVDKNVDRLEEIVLLKQQLRNALDSIGRMEEAISALVDKIGLDNPLPNPPDPVGSLRDGNAGVCQALPPRLRPPSCGN